MKKKWCERPLGVRTNRHSGLDPQFPPSCIMWPKILEINCSSFLIPSLHMVFQAQDLPVIALQNGFCFGHPWSQGRGNFSALVGFSGDSPETLLSSAVHVLEGFRKAP